MLKISEGMYVRTEKGEIKKIFQYDEQEDNLIWCTLNCHATIKSSIVKASHNIIDLIGVGDYVNGMRVLRVGNSITVILDNEENISWVKPADIKTILTKEVFKANEYRVETD